MSDNSKDFTDLSTKVAVIENEVDLFAKLFERLDKTLATLSEVSNSIQKLLAVHENRLENVEKNTQMLESFYNSCNKDLSTLIKELRAEIKSEITSLESEIQAINKWKWAIYGGCIVLGFIAANVIPFLKL